MKDLIKRFRVRVLYFAVGAAIGVLACIYAPSADAHNGGYSKDGCHWQNKNTEDAFLHDKEGNECVRVKKGVTRIIVKQEVEKIVEVPGPERIVKDVNVQDFENAMSRVIQRLDEAIHWEYNRDVKVVRVEIPVPDLKPTTEYCERLRSDFYEAASKFFGNPEGIAEQAIDKGCW